MDELAAGREADCLFWKRAGADRAYYVQDLAGGKPRPITPEGVRFEFGNPVSPDGAWVAGVGPDGRVSLYPIDRGAARPVPVIEPGDQPVQWSTDGKTLYLFRPGPLPVQVYRVDIAAGRRDLAKTILPPDPAGIAAVPWFLLTPDGQSYAYGYLLYLSDLFLAQGLK
jgi:eukaryotic-like serine/threonine-protein kinase